MEQERGMGFLYTHHLSFSPLRWMGDPYSSASILGVTYCPSHLFPPLQCNRDITKSLARGREQDVCPHPHLGYPQC